MIEFKYSVIIPHKNSPNLLLRCLKSIPKREDIQIIVVDDNSDASKVDFEHFPGEGEKGVEVYLTKEGRGAGYARNVGLKHAKGKWLIFADSDDYFAEQAFRIFEAQFENKADVIYFKSASVYSDTKVPADRADPYNALISRYLNTYENENHLRIGFEVPWAKMIRRQFVEQKGIRFDEVPAGNDVMFSTLSGYFARTIDVVQDCVYVVTVSTGSITKRKNHTVFLSRYKVSLRKNKFLKVHGLGRYQKSIMNNFLGIVKRKPGYIFYLCWLMIRYRQNPFIGIENWLTTVRRLHKQEKKDAGYFVK